ncbi:MAG: ribosome maturation factor RimM [Lapillicoccus sp.]
MDVSGPGDPGGLTVARIGKPHGLGGEVTVQLHTDDPERRLVAGASFVTEAASGSGVPRTLTIRSTRVHNGTWLLGFEEIPDRTGAESLRNTRLILDADEPTAEPDESDEGAWYEADLVGLEVVRQDGTRVGAVSGLELGPAQDLLVVALEAGGTAYLPFVEAIVPEVDVAGGRVVVDPPDGLLELNA